MSTFIGVTSMDLPVKIQSLVSAGHMANTVLNTRIRDNPPFPQKKQLSICRRPMSLNSSVAASQDKRMQVLM